MPSTSWLRPSKSVRTKARKARARRTLTLDHLEDRTLLAAEALDSSFGLGGKVVTDIGHPILNHDYPEAAAVRQADGKIVVTGTATSLPASRTLTSQSPWAWRSKPTARFSSRGTLQAWARPGSTSP